ncbi:MAG TPA: tetratricopeptide repeat protein [Gaiellaceae bacterium]|jgi:tetratricopeptide (TPR) repeat protein
MKTLRLDEIQGVPVFGTLVWKPVRRELGVTAFGINAYTAANPGDEVVEDHTEERLGHEEVYFVVAGRATFTVDGEQVDAPAGTLVYLDEPKQQRSARAAEAGTTVLAIGGLPGRHEISAWEYFFPALPAARDGDYERAIAILQEGIAERGEHPALLYNLACFEARAGRPEDALAHLNAAVAGDDAYREYARDDEDFASIRDDSRFPG